MFHVKQFQPYHIPFEYETVKTNKKIEYINVESGFDIETTSVYDDGGEKQAFMYVWMLGIGHDNPVIYGRTWEEFQSYYSLIVDRYQLHLNRRLVIYVHNLGYEFQFMRKYLEWESVFATGERKPLKAVTVDGIEFRDSYMLSGYSLENTAKNLTTHKVSKLSGELDYSLVRHHETPLSEAELAYCRNDVNIITAYISEQMAQYGNITKIPLTNTGRVRDYVRNNCYYSSKNHKKSNKGKYYRYRNIMKDLTLTVEDYVQLKQAFMGGFTHANSLYSGHLLEGVSSIDFTSSYPAVMLAEKFPMSRPQSIEITSEQHLEELTSNQDIGLMFNVTFQNIESNIPQENYISESKCFELQGSVINNGRVYSAEQLSMTITDVDFDIIQHSYKWQHMKVSHVKMFYMNYLPKAIIESVFELYEKKTVLKGVSGKEVEYLLSKGMLNSVYGMTVTDIIRDEHTYNDGWEVEGADFKESIEKYNESRNRFLYYPWGVWITAYSRRNLWSGILSMGNDYVYSDTDSIKLLNIEDHEEYLNYYNDLVIEKIKMMCDYHKLSYDGISPKNQNGEEKPIGVWDFEGTYTRFKTLGAKRYLVEEDGELYLTVAGLSKRNGLEYMKEQCDNDYSKVFDMFDDSLYIPANKTGKMTHTYIDTPVKMSVTDYKGIRKEVESQSSIHLENAEFTLSISKQYGHFLEQFTQGYVYKGVKFV